MAKTVIEIVKLQVKGAEAKPGPPVGPILGSRRVNIVEFCKQFNALTQDSKGVVLPVTLKVYSDRSFTFVVKNPTSAVLLMQAANVDKGSSECNRNKVGTVTWEDVKVIAERKMIELNAFKLKSAIKIIAGTARSIGVTITGERRAGEN